LKNQYPLITQYLSTTLTPLHLTHPLAAVTNMQGKTTNLTFAAEV